MIGHRKKLSKKSFDKPFDVLHYNKKILGQSSSLLFYWNVYPRDNYDEIINGGKK